MRMGICPAELKLSGFAVLQLKRTRNFEIVRPVRRTCAGSVLQSLGGAAALHTPYFSSVVSIFFSVIPI